jgi:hypothetical protein
MTPDREQQLVNANLDLLRQLALANSTLEFLQRRIDKIDPMFRCALQCPEARSRVATQFEAEFDEFSKELVHDET